MRWRATRERGGASGGVEGRSLGDERADLRSPTRPGGPDDEARDAVEIPRRYRLSSMIERPDSSSFFRESSPLGIFASCLDGVSVPFASSFFDDDAAAVPSRAYEP